MLQVVVFDALTRNCFFLVDSESASMEFRQSIRSSLKAELYFLVAAVRSARDS